MLIIITAREALSNLYQSRYASKRHCLASCISILYLTYHQDPYHACILSIDVKTMARAYLYRALNGNFKLSFHCCQLFLPREYG